MRDWKSRLSDIFAPPEAVGQAPSATPAAEPAAPVREPHSVPSHGHRTVRLLGRRSVAVTALDISPDAQTLVAAHADGQVRLLRAATGLLLHDLALPGPVQSLAISADGRLLALAVAAEQGLNTHTPHSEVRLYNLRHGTLEHSLEIAGAEVQALCFDPAGQLLAVAAGSALSLWDAWSGHVRQALKGHVHAVSCLAFSPDGQSLVSGDLGGCLQVWHVATGQAGQRLLQQGEISGLAISGDGVWLAWGTRDGTVLVSGWTEQRLVRVRQIEGQGMAVAGLRFSRDHRWLVIGKGAQRSQVMSAGSPQGLVRLWSTDTGELHTEHPMPQIQLCCLATSPDGRWLAVGSPNGAVHMIASEDGRSLRQFAREAAGVTHLALSPDQQWLVSGREDGQVSVWQPQQGTLLREMNVHRSPVCALGFSADGRWWASGAADGTVLLWGRGKAHPLHAEPGLASLSFCPHGRLLALAGRAGVVQLLSLREPLGKTLPVVHRSDHGIVGLRFSAHGQLLVWAREDGHVSGWDPASQQLRSTHQLPLRGLSSFALSDDMRWLAACDAAGQLLLWDFNADRLVWQHALGHLGVASALMFSADASVLHAAGRAGAQADFEVASGRPLGQRSGAAAHYACLGLAPARQALHAQALAGESIQLLCV